MFPFANMEIRFVLNGHDHVVPLSDIQTTAVIGILGLQGSGRRQRVAFLGGAAKAVSRRAA